jgi:HPt (histidine-containing phosphotransfer) domain-containing protein
MKQSADVRINALVADLWQKNLPTLRERLDLLDQVADLAATSSLPEPFRLEALSIAHKLSGSLGMFGHQQSTEIARSIEKVLRSTIPAELATLPTLTAELRSSLVSSL